MEENQNLETWHVLAKHTVQVDAPSPPPGEEFTSPFDSIKEWLSHICDTNNLNKPISEFHFSISPGLSRCLLSLEGYNSYYINPHHTVRRIDFKPVTNMYFRLPDNEFNNLSQQELKAKVLHELLLFIHSEKFKNSLLSKGGSIRFDLAGQIWPKE